MFRSRWSLALICLGTCMLAAQAKYKIGRPATPEQRRSFGPLVSATGRGLPDGRGSARDGRTIYEAQCATCHGEKGQGVGDVFSPLAGGQGSLNTQKPLQTVGSFWPYATSLWDYINRAMPYQDAGSLSVNEVYSVSAYVLFLNELVTEDQVLDQKTLPTIKMPNRDGLVPDPRPDVKRPDTAVPKH